MSAPSLRRVSTTVLAEAELLAETHISRVLAVGDTVYKCKKALAFGFVDQRSLADRRRLCEDEVALNRRLALDVYLGVADVVDGDAKVCDHAVVMRRLPADRSLAALLASGADVHDCVRDLARVVADFHARARRSDEISRAGSREAVRALWQASLDDMASFDATAVDRAVLATIRSQVDTYLLGRGPLFYERAALGCVVDGHGDLLAADAYCTDDGVRVLDCLEFDERFRYGDVLLDVAFLVMDLQWRARPDLAELFVRVYDELSDEHHPASLLAHFVAYRALVRAKVALYRDRDRDRDRDRGAVAGTAGPAPARSEAAGLLRLAHEQLTAGTVRLVLIGGLPGTGKSALAEALAARRGWVVVNTDAVRRELAGGPVPERWGEGVYRQEATDHVYQHVLTRCAIALARGETVIVDASFHDASRREAARQLAAAAGAALTELVCVAPAALSDRRLQARDRTHPSDATPDVAREMARAFAPWPQATVLDTTEPLDQTVRRASVRTAGS